MKKNKLNIEIGQRLKQIRKDLGLSQQEMASTLFVNKSMYQKYEIGRSIMPVWFLETCCTKYGVSLNWLVAKKGEKYINNQEGLSAEIETAYFKEASELLNIMKKNPVIRYSVLAHFQTLKVTNKEII